MLTSPLLFAAGGFWATLGSLKTRDNTSRRKLPGEAHMEGGDPAYTTLARCISLRCGWHRRCYLLPAMMNRRGTSHRSHLRGVVGDDWALAGTESRWWDARHGSLGGKGWCWVDERWTVAKGRANNARLTAHQLLVHMQSHRGRRVGET